MTAANEAFETRFDSEPSDTRVSAIFDQFNRRDTTGDGDPLAHLVRGDCVGIRLDGCGHEGPFFARVIPSDEHTGYVVFSDLRDCPYREDSPRAESDIVFEAGYSTRDGGTGLGLAIVERSVDAHDWERTLTDTDSGGVRFEVSV